MVPGRLLDIDHPRVQRVETDIFLLGFAPDCLRHACRCVEEGGAERADACCRFGADTDLHERDAILARAAEIAPVLAPAWRDASRWFDDSVQEPDEEFPSGVVTRTAVAGPEEDDGCVFLQHDRRGCALHRAALLHGFDPASIKPAVCRLFPLGFGEGTLGLSDDVSLYSCADAPGPSIYQVQRGAVEEVFGVDLVRLLDAAERRVLARRLRMIA